MPKVAGTRKQRARKLLERLSRGPSFNLDLSEIADPRDAATRFYRQWVESWVLDDVVDLIPELKEAKQTSIIDVAPIPQEGSR